MGSEPGHVIRWVVQGVVGGEDTLRADSGILPALQRGTWESLGTTSSAAHRANLHPTEKPSKGLHKREGPARKIACDIDLIIA